MLAPQPSASPELPGCTHRAGGSREDAQHLAPAAGLSPGPTSPASASLRFPQLLTTLPVAECLLCWGTGSFTVWVGEEKEEELSSQPGQELVLEQETGWQRQTCRACSHSSHPRSDTAFCHGFFAEWDPQGLSVFETCRTEQLGKTRLHLHLPSVGAREDRGIKCHRTDTGEGLSPMKIKRKMEKQTR